MHPQSPKALYLASEPMCWPLSFPSLAQNGGFLSSISALTGNVLEIYILKLISNSLIKNSGSVARNWGLGLPYRVRLILSLSDAQKTDSQKSSGVSEVRVHTAAYP